jgi:hypothetical protein
MGVAFLSKNNMKTNDQAGKNQPADPVVRGVGIILRSEVTKHIGNNWAEFLFGLNAITLSNRRKS